MNYKELKVKAKELGINPFGKKATELEQLITKAQDEKVETLTKEVEVKVAEVEKPEEVVPEVLKEGTVTIEGEIYELNEKGNPLPKFALTISNDYHYQQESTRLKLAIEPKVPFYVPLEPYDKDGTLEVVTINGYSYYLPKNEQHMIPRSVFKVLQNKLNLRDSTVVSNKYSLRDNAEKADKLHY